MIKFDIILNVALGMFIYNMIINALMFTFFFLKMLFKGGDKKYYRNLFAEKLKEK